MTFDLADRVMQAHERIRPDIRRTPIEGSDDLGRRTGASSISNGRTSRSPVRSSSGAP